MSKRCSEWSALFAILAVAATVVDADTARAGVREQAVIAVLKYAREIGVGAGAGVAGNYLYDKLHGSKAEASPAKIDDTRMRDLIRGMLADQKRLDTAASPPAYGSFASPKAIDFLKSCNESPACSSGLYRQIQTTR